MNEKVDTTATPYTFFITPAWIIGYSLPPPHIDIGSEMICICSSDKRYLKAKELMFNNFIDIKFG